MNESKLRMYEDQLSNIESLLKARYQDYSVLTLSCYQPHGAFYDNFGDLSKYLGRIAEIKEENPTEGINVEARILQMEKLIEELRRVFSWIE